MSTNGTTRRAQPEHWIDQPVLHTPYEEPDRHWSGPRGGTEPAPVHGRLKPEQNELNEGIKSAAEGHLFDGPDDEGMVATLRGELRDWRKTGWPGTTTATKKLLEYWSRPPGEGAVHSPFFAQREAVETLVYLTEVGNGNHWAVKRLRHLGEIWSRGITRAALRMATGTGKTMVMAMLIAWYAVNRRREHRHTYTRGLGRNISRIIVIAPGRTITRQLQALDPRRDDNIYDRRRLVPAEYRGRLRSVEVTAVNFEKLKPREDINFAGAARDIGKKPERNAIRMAGGETRHETAEEMWDRLIRRRGGREERVAIFNDEAHHCWERKRENEGEDDNGGVWMRALHALRRHPKLKLSHVVDLSATPIFINRAKTHTPDGARIRKDGTLVPWIVSEFPLKEAVEAGLVTIPRTAREANVAGTRPLRNLFADNNGAPLDDQPRHKLNKQRRRRKVLRAIELLYEDYARTFDAWGEHSGDQGEVGHPVMIVIADKIANARAFMEMIGGAKRPGNADIWDPPPGGLPLLSNVDRRGLRTEECLGGGDRAAGIPPDARTILVHSSGRGSAEKAENAVFGNGFIGVDRVTDRERVEQILATVGQPGKLGGSVRCVISVGMLTEGWDCQRVTHILGYRKFDSELLCEQTMGRALRRHDYDNLIESERTDTGTVTERFGAVYATILGIPICQTAGDPGPPPDPPEPPAPIHRVYPVPERRDSLRIDIPDFEDYTTESVPPEVELDPSKVEPWRASAPDDHRQTDEIRWVIVQGHVGKRRELRCRAGTRKERDPVWSLAARLAAEIRTRRDDDEIWRSARVFAHCLRVVEAWVRHPAVALDADGREALHFPDVEDLAVESLIKAIRTREGATLVKCGIPAKAEEPSRSAGDWRPFDTRLKHFRPMARSELNAAACQTEIEADVAAVLDRHGWIDSAVRNHGPDRIEIPYQSGGAAGRYVPDFFARATPRQAADGTEVTPHLVVEAKGPRDLKVEDKARWTREWWVPAANRLSSGGTPARWAYVEIKPGDDADAAIRRGIAEACGR